MLRRKPLVLVLAALFGLLLLTHSPPGRAEPEGAADVPDSSPASSAPDREGPSRMLLHSRLARETVAAALRTSRYAAAREQLASLRARTRSAALLPELSFRASHSTDQSLRLTPTLDEPDRYTQSGGAGIVLEARLAWQLDRLLYDRDELAVLRVAAERAGVAGKLAAQVLEALFTWHRAALRKDDERLAVEAREAAHLSALEAEITLDVLTGGWFTEEGLGRRRRSRSRPVPDRE